MRRVLPLALGLALAAPAPALALSERQATRIAQGDPTVLEQDRINGALSSAAHTAYHLGAIRQILAAMELSSAGMPPS